MYEYEDFLTFVREAVQPLLIGDPNRLRLDGETKGSNPMPFGRFRHRGRTWEINMDSRCRPLTIAYEAFERANDPFVEVPPDVGERMRLMLTEELFDCQRDQQQGDARYLYVYALE